MSNPNVEKLKALKLTIDKIDKDYGKGSVMMMNEKGEAEIEVVSTGSIGLQYLQTGQQFSSGTPSYFLFNNVRHSAMSASFI